MHPKREETLDSTALNVWLISIRKGTLSLTSPQGPSNESPCELESEKTWLLPGYALRGIGACQKLFAAGGVAESRSRVGI
jgi:hypothetical protein